ncbi:MAG: tyrosine-type recombinase/integrase [Cyanobacteriota bacterium]|nr:tyrosine-type recombinase/integrase [Cyanobacteriota bacterium]
MSGRGLFNPDGYQKCWNARFAVASVDHLQIENAGDGWSRRCIPLPTKRRSGRPDPALREKLASCRADVISWALAMPTEERDRILHNARGLFAQIRRVKRNAEIYGDSVKSFIEACLRPGFSTTRQIKSSELHGLYRAYCKAAGLKASSLPKFANHLKLTLPGHFVERQVGKANGKTVTIKGAHWIDIDLSHPDLFEACFCDRPRGLGASALCLSENLTTQFKSRTAYLPEGAIALVESWLEARGTEPGALLCPIRKGGEIQIRSMTPQAVLLIVQKRAQQAGVESFSPHDFRRTFCSDLLDAGVDTAQGAVFSTPIK